MYQNTQTEQRLHKKQQVYTRYMEEKTKIEIILQYWNWEGYKVSLFPHRLTWQHNIPRRRRVLLFVIAIDSHTTSTNSSWLLKQGGAAAMGHSDGCHEVWQRGIIYHFCYSFSIQPHILWTMTSFVSNFRCSPYAKFYFPFKSFICKLWPHILGAICGVQTELKSITWGKG